MFELISLILLGILVFIFLGIIGCILKVIIKIFGSIFGFLFDGCSTFFLILFVISLIICGLLVI